MDEHHANDTAYGRVGCQEGLVSLDRWCRLTDRYHTECFADPREKNGSTCVADHVVCDGVQNAGITRVILNVPLTLIAGMAHSRFASSAQTRNVLKEPRSLSPKTWTRGRQAATIGQ